MRGRSSKRQPSNALQRQPEAERVSLQLIADKLARLTWRRRLWGVDERQVWHVVQRLDEMYRQLYREQEVRYQALLEQARPQGSQPGRPQSQVRQQPQQPQPTQGRQASGSAASQAVRAQTQAQVQQPTQLMQPVQLPSQPRPQSPVPSSSQHRFRTS